ncbi:speckle-type POZ protein-like isoform X1 [Leptopilina heterotoma]|uniref:speckle-type POZ protein-like isoform X1 n=1 Tax=Leptopilina heterotoma TaxID=63436 RepID=UPI001CA91352|nr:speckle-type POZ protein-like isoform X1 [Leptopilina heterotoma]XP_043468162.1 speckle-type POZ protein-like isoform X1 [Leptopilina heterotoma]XP_043468164.1 speckle-type POZ protein-like isoform X1 [Leptopilina heterotoma]
MSAKIAKIAKMDNTSMLTDTEEKNYISQAKYRHYSLKWTINEFDLVCNTMKAIESPRFPATPTKEGQWFFRLELVKLEQNNDEIFKIILSNTSKMKTIIECDHNIFNSSKIGLGFHATEFIIKLERFWTKSGSDMFKHLEWDKVEDKTVTLICKLSVFDSFNDIIPKQLTHVKEDNLLNQIECFYDDQTFKDVTLRVDDKEFNAHKTILILRSPVFAAMFKSKMTEEQTSSVEIKDINPTIFQKMLRFIYTEKVEDLEDSAAELYYAAEKYQLGKLKTMCINSLYKNLSTDSVIETLKLAEIFSIFDLKRKAFECLASNLEELKETHEFLQLAENFPHFYKEISKVQKVNNDCKMNCAVQHSAATKYELKFKLI